MKKWAVSALIYLLVVIGAYVIFTQVFTGKENEQQDHDQIQETSGDSHVHEGHDKNSESNVSQLKALLNYKGDTLSVKLTDEEGKPFDNLLINHEKLMHVIIVDEHLEQFQHVHPEKTGAGEFILKKSLAEGQYKVFVDIKPDGLSYQVEPIQLNIGNNAPEHSHNDMQPDQVLTKKVDAYEVTLNLSNRNANQPVSLSFDLDKTVLEPYLGAMGHIVILNETADKYVHVHPKNDHEPVFETEFDKPGTYKIWAEFKQKGVVRVFPFIVEIK